MKSLPDSLLIVCEPSIRKRGANWRLSVGGCTGTNARAIARRKVKARGLLDAPPELHMEDLLPGSTSALAVLAAAVVLVLWRLPAARGRFSRRPALMLGLLASLTGQLVLYGATARDWIATSGFQWRGVCPGGPPDIAPHLCTFPRFVASALLSPFAAFGSLLFSACWSVLWCGIGLVGLLSLPEPEKSRLRNGVRAVLASVAALPIALVATLVCQLLLTWSAQTAFARAGSHEATIASAALVGAWGLNVRDPRQLEPATVSLPDPLHGNTDVYFALQEGDARRVLARWPKTCWQTRAALPAWLSEPARTLVPPPHDSAPNFMLRPDLAYADSQVVLGVKLSKRGPWAPAPRWARTFNEARAGLAKGELAWEWFVLEVTTTPGSNALHVRQRGHARTMKDWQPICESDGASVDALERSPVVYGALSGRVESERDPTGDGRRRRLAGAKLLFAHENGWIRKQTESADDGSYAVRLPVGRYRVRVTHPDYRSLEPEAGFTVVTPQPHYARYFLQAR